MSATKNAIIKALLEGVITELMIKSNITNIYMDDGQTTLASKMAEMVAAINEKAKAVDVTAEINNAVNALKQEMMGDAPIEAYNTFTELAAYISQHQEAADALTEAIGNKADKSTVDAIKEVVSALGNLAQKDTISESDLDNALKEKVNASSEGNHSHLNKAVLDMITENDMTAWDNAAEKAHEHNNKSVLDGITVNDIAAWNKKKITIGTSQPADLAAGELFIHIV